MSACLSGPFDFPTDIAQVTAWASEPVQEADSDRSAAEVASGTVLAMAAEWAQVRLNLFFKLTFARLDVSCSLSGVQVNRALC